MEDATALLMRPATQTSAGDQPSLVLLVRTRTGAEADVGCRSGRCATAYRACKIAADRAPNKRIVDSRNRGTAGHLAAC